MPASKLGWMGTTRMSLVAPVTPFQGPRSLKMVIPSTKPPLGCSM